MTDFRDIFTNYDEASCGVHAPTKLELLQKALERVHPYEGFYTSNPYGPEELPRIVGFNWIVKEILQELIKQCNKNT